MSTISEQLEQLATIKSDIKAAIIDKGQTVGDDFSTYATAIGNIEGGGGGETTVIKQGAISAGAFAFYNSDNYGEDEDTAEVIDSLFSRLDASALHEDFDGNVVSVSQALAAAIGFSYNSTDNIIYYSFGDYHADQYGFRIIQDDNDAIYIEIVYNNTDTYNKGHIHFSLGSKYIIYNSDQGGSVILSKADSDGVPSLEDCLFASPYTYTYNDQTTVEKSEGYVLPSYSTGYTSLTIGYFDYKLDGNPAYPGYPTQLSYGVDPIICLTPYGYTNEDTNPVGVYFTNVYLITRMGYHSGCYIINLEGTYYLMIVSSDGNCGGIAFRLAETTTSLITKSITSNGTYNASDDDADGYSSVTVAVPGGGSSLGDSHIELMASSLIYPLEYTFEDGGTYLVICAYPHSGTGSITFDNATVISDATVTLSECAALCKIVEVEANDTVTINCTWETGWPGRAVAIFKLSGFTIDTATEVIHIGTKDGTTTYTLPSNNNCYLVYGLGLGRTCRNDTSYTLSTEILTGTYGYSSISSIVICKGNNSPNFSFYGYDGGYSTIMAWKIIPN